VRWSGGADSAEVRREQELRRSIAELARRLEPRENVQLALRGATDPPSSPGIAREALDRAETQYAALLLTLRERAPKYASLVEARAPGWREVASRLPASVALLEYLLTDSAATLFVVRTDGVRAIDLGSDRRTIASMVEFARGTLVRPSGPERSRAVLVRLHQLLVAPAEASGALRGVERLLVVPHAELNYLPFAALRAPGAEGRYLVERYALATVPSAAAWLAVAARERPLPRSPRVLALAPRPAQLPGTRREVEAIRALAPERTTVLMGAQASAAGLDRSLKGHDILHLATYGVLNRRNPLFSHVELAPAPGDDGRLAVHDVYGLPLDARLVVLSACQTALGSGYRADVPAGDEWVGLSQAFLAAGASRVVATLWLVDDRATSELMARLHAGLADGQDAASALAAAQRQALADTRLRDPFFWAGVTLIGGL
jgi:CHAT domain-containing protein